MLNQLNSLQKQVDGLEKPTTDTSNSSLTQLENQPDKQELAELRDQLKQLRTDLQSNQQPLTQ